MLAQQVAVAVIWAVPPVGFLSATQCGSGSVALPRPLLFDLLLDNGHALEKPGWLGHEPWISDLKNSW
jgi:hypothetical protein